MVMREGVAFSFFFYLFHGKLTMSDEHKIPFFDDYGVTDGNMRKAYDKLELYVCAGRPLIYIQSFDFAVVDSMIARVARSNPERQMDIMEYVDGVGIVSFDRKEIESDYENLKTLKSCLLYFVNAVGHWDSWETPPKPIILLLKNVHKELDQNSEIQSLLRQLASVSMHEHGDVTQKTSVYIVVVSPELSIPVSLERLMALIKLEAPKEKEIREHIHRMLEELAPRVELSEDACDKIISPLLGLSMVEIDQVMTQLLADNIPLEGKKAQDAILEEKRQLIQKTGLLKIVDTDFDKQEIGGLTFLQDYLDKEAKIYNYLDIAEKHHVEIPKGVLIVGMPGCGKTLTAKMAAKKFNTTLICLDIGRLMGQYVGQSEENMRRALAMVESVAPCVLWIDELEKAFSGVGSKGLTGGSEVSTRLFGYFLTWMQEKRDSVYVIATANRINQLPPELLRRGRFDEIFRVDFPTEKEQEAIYKVHLKKRGKVFLNVKFHEECIELDEIGIPVLDVNGQEKKMVLWSLTQPGFCGADIATIVGRAFKNVFLKKMQDNSKHNLREHEEVATVKIELEDIQKELQAQSRMTPLKKVLADDIREIERMLNKYNFLSATTGESVKTEDEFTLDELKKEMERVNEAIAEENKKLNKLQIIKQKLEAKTD